MVRNSAHSFAVLACITTIATAQAPFDWTIDPTPPSRYNARLLFFPQIDGFLMFGGEQGGPFGDTWRWRDGWQRLSSPSSPSPRSGAGLAVDTLRGRVVLFGGRDKTHVLGDTWSHDGAGWTQLSPLVSPPGRYFHGFLYDAARDRMISRGGRTTLLGGSTTEIWEFDGATWTLMPQGGVAPPMYGALVHDVAGARNLEYDASGLHAWDGANWSAVASTGLPANTDNGMLLYDPQGQRVLLVNPTVAGASTGNVYALQGSVWTQVTALPPPTARPMLVALDPVRQQMLGFEVSTGSSAQDPRSNTWLFSGSHWAFTHSGAPLDRYFAAMVYDSQRHCMVLHGGFQGIFTLTDTYELEDTVWHLGSTGLNTSALNRAYMGMAYDATRGRTVMIGGTSFQNPVAEWNGSAWAFPSATYAPAERQRPGFVFDSTRHRCVLFGGQGTAEFADTWAWNGSVWVDLTNAGPAPSPRHAVGMAYDSDRDRVVLFGGTDGTTRFGDTWEFDGSAWLARTPAATPTARFGHAQGYDPDRHRTFVFGGDDGGDPRDLWEWDGGVWQQRTLPHMPDTGIGVCGAYDESRQEIVLFGGEPAHGETWRLRDTSLGFWSSTGQGCDTGNGPLALATQDPLALGRTSNLDVTHLPAHLAVLASVWVGFDDTQWNGVPLPFSLTSIGRPTCSVWAEPVVAIWLANLGTGSAQAAVAIPSDPGFLGLRLFAQAVSYELGVAQFSTANLLSASIGPR